VTDNKPLPDDTILACLCFCRSKGRLLESGGGARSNNLRVHHQFHHLLHLYVFYRRHRWKMFGPALEYSLAKSKCDNILL